MRPTETVSGLADFDRRGPGTDAERRAATWLADGLVKTGRDARIEPFWCRPNWAVAHVWHIALAIAGSLIAIPSPTAGAVVVAIALISTLADATVGISPGRRLSPERASQNVVATPPTASTQVRSPVKLIVTANYDAGRAALAYRPAFRRPVAALRHAFAGRPPGWIAWETLAITWLLATSILRIDGVSKQTVGAIQLIPDVGLLIGFALLIDLAGASWSPAAGDNASGVALAIAIAAAIDAAPPPGISVEIVLAGAGEGGGIGLRKYLRANRRELQPSNAIVLGIAASGGGRPRWWVSDGPFVPLRYSATLRRLCKRVADDEPHLNTGEHRGRGATPALPARARRLPAIAIGCVDDRGLAPRSHQPTDSPESIDQAALDDALQFALMLVDEIGEYVEQNPVSPAATSTPA
ncbi:MAG TPA: M28 family peptidase [Solirubrobacteraceae bacterium]